MSLSDEPRPTTGMIPSQQLEEKRKAFVRPEFDYTQKSRQYTCPNSTWLVTSRHDTTRSTCRVHAFWLCRVCRTARLDTLDTTGSTRRARQVEHVEPMHFGCVEFIKQHGSTSQVEFWLMRPERPNLCISLTFCFTFLWMSHAFPPGFRALHLDPYQWTCFSDPAAQSPL